MVPLSILTNISTKTLYSQGHSWLRALVKINVIPNWIMPRQQHQFWLSARSGTRNWCHSRESNVNQPIAR